jgi:uncharacterized membrane protein YcaP (DUF421 family)
MDGNFWLELLDIVIRSIVSIVILFLLTKLMGKRQISQLTFFDYVISISIGSIAASFAIDREVDYAHGIAGLAIYSLFALLLTFISYKCVKARQFLAGMPIILIEHGRVIDANLKKSKLNINDLLEECRMKNAFNISDVEYGIMETSGKVSILLKAEKQPLTPEDMKIPVEYNGILANLIIDGKIMHKHLTLVSRTTDWLKEELLSQGIVEIKDVLLASLDSKGNLFVDLKSKQESTLDVLE